MYSAYIFVTYDETYGCVFTAVGEWSMRTTEDYSLSIPDKQQYVDACVAAFSRASAWYVFTWKLEREAFVTASSSWSLQRQLSDPKGLRIHQIDASEDL